MNRKVRLPAVCIAFLFLTGCAPASQNAKIDREKLIQHETEQRLQSLESSVAALNGQVAILNNRVYEVRSKNGKKTGMTVVPLQSTLSPAPAAPTVGTTPSSSPQEKASPAPVATSAPRYRVVDPTPPPRQSGKNTDQNKSTPAKTERTSMPTAGPSGRMEMPPSSSPETASSSASLPASNSPSLQPEPALPPSANAPASNAERNPADIKEASSSSNVPLNPAEVPAPALPQASAPVLPATASQEKQQPQQNLQPVKTPPVQSPTPLASRPRSGVGEEAAYKSALKLARSGRNEDGIQAFRSFLQQFPQGRYAANAEYWIGECYYAQGKYGEALKQFETVNRNYPRHHKNADALLKAGMTNRKLGKKQEASEDYKKLLQLFPNSEAAGRLRAKGMAR
ncbi:MAG: tol-pal system protein YbgF [Desulfovibrio sp.]|nr:tol-pal system protein YbgF [Desulfovibrio sp.]